MKVDFDFEKNVGKCIRVWIVKNSEETGSWVEGTLIKDSKGYFLFHHNPDFHGAIPKDFHLRPGEYSWCISWIGEVNLSIHKIELIKEKPSPWMWGFDLEAYNGKQVSVLVDANVGFAQWIEGTLHRVNLMPEGGTDTHYYLLHNDPKFDSKQLYSPGGPYSILLYSKGKYETNILNICSSWYIQKPKVERTSMPIRLVFEKGENIPGSMLGRDIDKVVKSKILGEEMFIVYYGTDGK